jgi:predicted small secreted protein
MRRTLAKAFLSLFILGGAAATLSACHTVEDISGTGRAIQRAF